MDDVWVAIIGSCALFMGHVLTLFGQWLGARKNVDAKALESDADVAVAKINAHSNERIELAKTLLAHNQALQTHSAEQDQMILKLTEENARLTAQLQLLATSEARKAMDVARLEEELDDAEKRVRALVAELSSPTMVMRAKPTTIDEGGDTDPED